MLLAFVLLLFVLLAIGLPLLSTVVLWRTVTRLSRRVEALEATLRTHSAPAVPPAPTPALPPEPVPAAEPVPEREPVPVIAARETAESWELTVGTSWLNKVGVLVFVMGLALLVGYSFTHIGAVGRIAVGYAISAVMLAAGVRLERRPEFRTYAYGLIGGGWAGLYFTTFAMHALPGARILESDLAAVLLLSIVAAGMIVHSLKYRSQTVTALACIVAYVTLALSPLSGFAIAAALPLSASVLVVSHRLGWPKLAALGIAATYTTFVLRDGAYPGGVLDPYSSLPYLALAAYWLTFEGVEIASAWLRRQERQAAGELATPMLALNTAGALGALVVTVPGDDPQLFSTALFVAGAAHVASAIVRARLSPRHVSEGDEPAFDRTHWATALAAALFVWAIAVRFDGPRESLALLLLTQLLFAAGRMLSDVWVRRMASVTAAIATANAGAPALWSGAALTVLSDVRATSIVAGVMALAWYANAEILHRHEARRAWLEPAYSWMATALVGIVISVELLPAHQGLAGLALAWVLLEAALRRRSGFDYQAAIAGVCGAYTMLLAFVVPQGTSMLRDWGPAPTPFDDWTVLPAGIVIASLIARRLTTAAARDAVEHARVAEGAASITAVVLLLLFERRVLPPIYIGPAWTATGVLLLSGGLWQSTAVWRWAGYGALLLGLSAAAHHVFDVQAPSARAIVLLVAVIAALYACSVTVGRAIRSAQTNPVPSEAEGFVPAVLSLIAAGMLLGLIFQEVRPSLVTLAVGLQGLASMAAGLAARERILRLSGLGLLFVCVLKLFLYDLSELDALARILSFVALGLILLAISWTYTRYRDQISKLL